MKNCPSCELLMDDHEELCGPCAADRANASSFLGSASVLTIDGPLSATAVLSPPASVPQPERVVYRNPHRRRNAVRAVMAFVLLLGGVAALVVLGAEGDGPLARSLVDAGLIEAPVVDVPSDWAVVTSGPGQFVAAVPMGAEEVGVGVDPADPGSGGPSGFTAQLGEEGSMSVVSIPVGPEVDSDAGFAATIGQFAAMSGLGEETIRREAPVGDGRAADVVFVEGDSSTTRVRFQMTGGRLYVLSTGGSDLGADELDAAHARLIDGFRAT